MEARGNIQVPREKIRLLIASSLYEALITLQINFVKIIRPDFDRVSKLDRKYVHKNTNVLLKGRYTLYKGQSTFPRALRPRRTPFGTPPQ